jgi:adenosylcobinamide-GDP ribazoletransferase
MTAALRGLPAAFGFLTRLPVGGFPYTADELRWSSAHFPLVGAVLGGVLAAVMTSFARAGPVVAAALAICIGMLLTGAFHEDGLADTADALGGASDRDQLFRILRDSRIGSFGAAALCMVLVLRVALLSTLAAAAPVALVLTQTLARLPPVWMMALLPSVSPEGAKSAAVARPGGTQLAVATGWAALVLGGAIAARLLDWRSLTALIIVAVLTTAACGIHFIRRAGGWTGDFLGATEQVLECVLLLTLALRRGGDVP